MHIKHIIIKNFKSYRDLAYIEPLDPSVNVIIGGNGQGKSNLIDAIIFVLTDKYNNLRQEDKKLLIHEEFGEVINEVSVELVIDNKSRRIPIDKDTVSITKTYYPKEGKEDLIINQKKLLKSEVQNILESCGFYKHNPYYIIQQGRINSLINMNEFELYQLIAEVSGTKLYEQKKIDSLKILEETNVTKEKILKQSEEISSHIQKLQQQCTELKDFENYENERKVIEYFINNEKLHVIQLSLEYLEDKKNEKNSSLELIYTTEQKIKEKISNSLRFLDLHNKKKTILQNRIEIIDNEISKLSGRVTTNNNALNDIKKENKSNLEEKKKLNSVVKNLYNEKETLSKEIEISTKKANDLSNELLKTNKLYSELNEKGENFMMRFNGKYCGDNGVNFFNQEINKLLKLKEELISAEINLTKEIESEENNLIQLKSKIDAENKFLNESQTLKKKVQEELLTLKKNRYENTCEVKAIINEVDSNSKEIEFLTDNNKDIEKIIPGVEIVKTINKISNENFPGMYGCLINLINIKELNNRIRTAIDQGLKDKLYTIIVDKVSTAEKIMEYNIQNNGAVISIFPIEWLDESSMSIPKYQLTSDITPLINSVKIKNDYAKIFGEKTLQCILNKFFGKILLVNNYDLGTKYAKEFNVKCITPENEVINAGGFDSRIGYYNAKKERLILYNEMSENSEKLKNYKLDIELLLDRKSDLLNKEAKILREIQPAILKIEELENKISTTEKNIQTLNQELSSINEIRLFKRNSLEKLIQEKNIIISKCSNYQNLNVEKKVEKLTEEKEKEINSILMEKDKVKKVILELETMKNNFISKIIEKKESLKNTLLQINDISNQLNELSINGNQKNYNFDEEGENNKDLIEYNLEKNSSLILKFTQNKKQYIAKLSEIEKDCQKVNEDLNDFKKDLETVTNQKNLDETGIKSLFFEINDYLDKKQKLFKKISLLGQIKSDMLEEFNIQKGKLLEKLSKNQSNLSAEEKLNYIITPFQKKLHGLDKNMKDFEKINRFAIEDYRSFKEKETEIELKLIELKDKEVSIYEVIDLLDEKKENAINSTFNKLNKVFIESFKELVPNGDASLFLEEVDISQKNSTQNNKYNKSKLVGIRVSFGGNNSSLNTMHKLSGGQKTAVAIILTFSLSKIDMAPFYILDEIDADLDPVLRVNLAKMIKKLSQENQFLIATFKPEILEVSNKIYQVKFSNKTSSLFTINKNEAKSIINEITNNIKKS